MKNITYCTSLFASRRSITYTLARTADLAKVSDYILVPEHFALHLGTHVLSKYAHLQKAFVTIEQLRWSRITVSGQDVPHTHAFYRDGDDKRVVQVAVSLMSVDSIWEVVYLLLVVAASTETRPHLVAFRVEPAMHAVPTFGMGRVDSTWTQGLACGAKWNSFFLYNLTALGAMYYSLPFLALTQSLCIDPPSA